MKTAPVKTRRLLEQIIPIIRNFFSNEIALKTADQGKLEMEERTLLQALRRLEPHSEQIDQLAALGYARKEGETWTIMTVPPVRRPRRPSRMLLAAERDLAKLDKLYPRAVRNWPLGRFGPFMEKRQRLWDEVEKLKAAQDRRAVVASALPPFGMVITGPACERDYFIS